MTCFISIKKTLWRKHEIKHKLVSIIVSLKTLYGKNEMVKTHKRKKSTM